MRRVRRLRAHTRRLRVVVAALLLLPLLAAPALALPDLSGKFLADINGPTEHKPQSKLWFHDGAWWAIAYDGSNQKIWKFENGDFVRQTSPDATVDSRASARADALWDGTYLYVLMWHSTTPRFSKYSYDPATRTYTRLPGFPLDIPVPGTEVMVLDRDSTGRLWASYEKDNAIHVIWTTTPDHLTWNTSGTTLATGVDGDDICTTIAFGGDRIGVFWSDQGSWQYGFRAHHDGDAPELWDPLEIVDTGSTVDDHINAACDGSGRVHVATKDIYNHVNVHTRSPAGTWSEIASNVNGGSSTRPIVMVDADESELVVLYTDWENEPNDILMVRAPLGTGSFGAPEVYLRSTSGSFLNNVTGTKQFLGERGGLMVMASSSSSVYWGFTNYDTTKPDVDAIYPADEQPGVPVDPVVRVRVQDAGMGVDPSSIVMRIDGAEVTHTISGTADDYVVQWTPAIPLQDGRIYQIDVEAKDNAYPPLRDAETYQFKTEMAPAAISGRINFQPATMMPPDGWDADWGREYSLARGVGWNKSTVSGKRGGTHPDPLLDTYVDRKNSWGKATWSYDVPNGLYSITVVAGSPVSSGKHGVEVETDVLLSGQTTQAGGYITISDYEVAVTDGQLSLKMGGAGGSSTRTQICYFTFDYLGEIPPPPPPEGETPPAPVAGLQLATSGSDLVLTWNPVTEDTSGAPITASRYAVYRGSVPDFAPDRADKINRVGLVAGTTFTDLGALGTAEDMYYYVTAERSDGTESPANSDLGVRRRITLSPAAGDTLVTWVALPYQHGSPTASDLVSVMHGGLVGGPVLRLSRIDRDTQERLTYAYVSGAWSGTDFALPPEEACEVTLTSPLGWNAIGVEADAPAYDFTHHASIPNLNWIALPTNVAYADARELVEGLNDGAARGPVTKVARLTPSNGQIESYVFFAGTWRGANFPLEAGIGVAIFPASDLNGWIPSLLEPATPAPLELPPSAPDIPAARLQPADPPSDPR